MKKKLFLLITCFFLCSSVIIFFSFRNRQSAKITKNGKIIDKNDNENKKPNSEEVIINEDDYFFNRTSGQVIMNILLFLGAGILFFFWENDKFSIYDVRTDFLNLKALCGAIRGKKDITGLGLFEKLNWYGLATLFAVLIITLLVELILHLLIGSLSHLLSKDKSKKYFQTLNMSLKKRIKIFSSFSKMKTLFIVLSYLLCAFVIAIFARLFGPLGICCITDHGTSICCGFGRFELQKEEELSDTEKEEKKITEKKNNEADEEVLKKLNERNNKSADI